MALPLTALASDNKILNLWVIGQGLNKALCSQASYTRHWLHISVKEAVFTGSKGRAQSRLMPGLIVTLGCRCRGLRGENRGGIVLGLGRPQTDKCEGNRWTAQLAYQSQVDY
jgi:hypothetical protein